MSEVELRKLAEVEAAGEIELGRGEVISSKDLAVWPGNYPVYSSSAVGEGEFGRYGRYMFDEDLITWSIDGGGRPFYRRKHKFSVTNVSGYLKIRRPEKWDYVYLHALLSRLQASIQFDYQMKAHPSVIRELYQLRWVPIEEQRKIAQILDTLDTQIRQTEALIAKLEQIKQGLLTDLLTRGIDEHGQLRPPPEQAPQLYKDSPLGRIPREWRIAPVNDLLAHVIDFRGRTPKKLGMKWGGGSILALSANNVKTGYIDPSREAYYGGNELYERWMTQGDSQQGDVLLTMEAPLGNVAQIPDSRRYILSQRVVLLRFRCDILTNDFAFWQMQSGRFQRLMLRHSTGTTATGIQRARLERLPFLVPPLAEQQSIDSSLRAMDARLLGETKGLRKLCIEKAGLMDDVLTGRIRVTPLLERAEQAAS